MSCGERPGHLVKTICWFSPKSGIASTGTGSFGKDPICQLKGAVNMPQAKRITNKRKVTNLFSKKKRITLFIMNKHLGYNRNMGRHKPTFDLFKTAQKTID